MWPFRQVGLSRPPQSSSRLQLIPLPLPSLSVCQEACCCSQYWCSSSSFSSTYRESKSARHAIVSHFPDTYCADSHAGMTVVEAGEKLSTDGARGSVLPMFTRRTSTPGPSILRPSTLHTPHASFSSSAIPPSYHSRIDETSQDHISTDAVFTEITTAEDVPHIATPASDTFNSKGEVSRWEIPLNWTATEQHPSQPS
jgi:hypothetical protein